MISPEKCSSIRKVKIQVYSIRVRERFQLVVILRAKLDEINLAARAQIQI